MANPCLSWDMSLEYRDSRIKTEIHHPEMLGYFWAVTHPNPNNHCCWRHHCWRHQKDAQFGKILHLFEPCSSSFIHFLHLFESFEYRFPQHLIKLNGKGPQGPINCWVGGRTQSIAQFTSCQDIWNLLWKWFRGYVWSFHQCTLSTESVAHPHLAQDTTPISSHFPMRRCPWRQEFLKWWRQGGDIPNMTGNTLEYPNFQQLQWHHRGTEGWNFM